MNETTIRDSADAAASWWAERLAPVFQDNGDRSENGLFAGVLGGFLAAQNRPEPEQVERFRKVLASLVRREFDEHPYFTQVGLHTDYGPDRLLAKAADEAGISNSVFPWKTNTWVYPDHFVVSGGHQAQRVLAWSSESCEPKPCHTQRYDDTTYKPLPGKCGQEIYHAGPCDWSVPSPLCTRCGEPEHYFFHEGATYPESHAFTLKEQSQ